MKEGVGATTVNLLSALGIDEYLTRTTGGTTEYLLSEALGTTVALADGSGAVATEYSYEPFGEATASGTSSSNELGYTGRENDGTGLYYYRARYYHTFGQLAAGAAIGCAGGVGVLAGYAVAAGSAISSAAAAPAGWPLVPSAVAKLQNVADKFGTTSDEILNMARASNARFIDLLQKNFGNVNIYLARPDGAPGFIRVTLDPTQSRVVSAGMVRAGQVGNAVVNGCLIPAE